MKMDNQYSGAKVRTVSSSKGITQLQVLGVIFVVIFTAMLVSNISLSETVKQDAGDINLAGRQRMLSQRLTKSTANLQSSLREGRMKDAEEDQAEILLSYNLFNDTLKSFLEGGKTQGAAGKEVYINAVSDQKIKKHAEEAAVIWKIINQDLNYIATDDLDKINKDRVDRVVNYLTANNLKLLKLMNSLTVGLDGNSQNTSSKQQKLLWVALALVFAIFAYIFLYALKGLKKRDKDLAAYANELGSNYTTLQDTNYTLEQTQLQLNSSNDSLTDALDSVRQTSEVAQARADELQEITVDLNRMKEEGDTIFNAVDHGLCLLDNNAKIGQRVSKATYDIFETEQLEGRSFVDLMRPLITEKDLKTLSSFIKLQFNKKSLKSQLEKYNPLKKIEVTLQWDGNKFTNKHLGFEFERILEKGEIVAVLVTITDVTETVALEKELKRANEDQEKKTGLILEIIQSDKNELELFLAKTGKELDEINRMLKEAGVSEDSISSRKDVVENVFRSVHNIKGNASMLGLNTIVDVTHDVESKLVTLREKADVKGEEFLSSLLQLATLREYLEDYEEITHNILKDFANNNKLVEEESKEVSQSSKFEDEITNYISTLSKELGKKVYTRCSFEMEEVSESGMLDMKDIIIQIARNAVAHGIEKPQERQQLGKLEEGSFIALCELDNSSDNILGRPAYKFTFRDDGRGLDLMKLKQKAVDLSLKTKKQVATMSDAQLASLIFEPAFSTQEVVNEHSGRGMGMDIIKDKIVTILKGKLTMNFSPGSYMQLSCYIPVESLNSKESKKIA